MFRNSRTLVRRCSPRLLRFAAPLVVLMTGAASLGVVPAAQAATAPAGKTFTVSSTRGWQQVPITLKAGERYTVSSVSGNWTVDYRNFPRVGPGGYSNSVDQTIYQGCKYNPDSNYAVLLGRSGSSGTAFPIGQGGIFNASSTGPLYLRINDDDACLGDNAGSVTMYVSPVISTPFGTYAGYTAEAAGAEAGAKGAFGLVEATWVVPGISTFYCLQHPGVFPRVAPWVGLWGTNDSILKNTAWLPQIGTVSSCNNGFPGPHYVAFWEMFTNVKNGGAKGIGEGVQTIPSMTIKPGDMMTGDVEFEGTSGSDLKFNLQLIDSTRTKPGSPDQFSITVTTAKPVKFSDIMAQGGAVVEPEPNCMEGLAKFTSVPFTNVQAVPWNGTAQPAGMSLNKWTMLGKGGKVLAQAGPLYGFPGLMNYTVTYQAGGPTTC
jgi:hypothetical protein